MSLSEILLIAVRGGGKTEQAPKNISQIIARLAFQDSYPSTLVRTLNWATENKGSASNCRKMLIYSHKMPDNWRGEKLYIST